MCIRDRFRRERTVFSFNASRVGIITAVSFKVINDYPKCFLNYISGGIGRKNLTVEVKSAFNKGFCVQMDIFGYPVFQRKHRKRPKNTTDVYKRQSSLSPPVSPQIEQNSFGVLLQVGG